MLMNREESAMIDHLRLSTFSNSVRTRNGQHHNDLSRIARHSRNRSDLIAERDVCIELFWLLAL